MASFFGDLTANANCGTANPIAQALASQMSMNAQLADVKGMQKPMGPVAAGNAPPPQLLQPLKPSTAPPVVNAFQQQFEQQQQTGPKPHFMPPPMMRPPSMQAAPPPLVHTASSGAKPLDAGSMINEFQRMASFEDAYRAGAAPPQASAAPPMLQRPHSLPQQQQPPPQQMAPSPMGNAWVANFRAQQMALANAGPNPDFAAMYQHIVRGPQPQQWNDEFQRMQQQLAMAQISSPPQQQQQQQASAPPSQQANSAAPSQQAEFESTFAEAQANGNAFVDEFLAQQQEAAQGGPPLAANGQGMGMDQDMLNKLRTSSDPKWRNSKFLKFLDQISKGEIEFKDNRAVLKPGTGSSTTEKPQVAGTAPDGQAWAENFAAANPGPIDPTATPAQPAGQLARAPSGTWADQFTAEQNQANPDQWASQFAALQQAAQQAGGDAATASADWARQFAEQNGGGAASDEVDFSETQDYTNVDWHAALQRAKDAVPQAKDPEYKFALNNPYANSKDPMGDGLRCWKAGKLKDAILNLEVEVQKNPDNAEAWRCIGEIQAENEDEHGAISGLLKCISIDPYNLKALLMLGVSYTNDLEETRALKYLKTWMMNHPDYHGQALASSAAAASAVDKAAGGAAAAASAADPEVFGGVASRLSLHDEVTKMFLDACRINPRDADLHTVLGVLFHISNDFDKAIDAFKTAVKLRPDDPCLWNKLGATQANSNRSGDAVHAYKRALELRPGYVRALANLAISFANQGRHAEAAQTYLATLKHNPDANHVWSYLRISLGHMGKDNLVDLTLRKDVELFRPFFQF